MFRREVIALASMTLSCGVRPATPTGEPVPTFEQEKRTAVASAARDIPCETGKVVVITWVAPKSSRDLIVVEGCGQRLSYVCDSRCELFSKLPAAPGGQP
jgi:hypothetical protein